MIANTAIVIETDRLILRKFTLSDAAFVLELLNSPNWLEFIGDKSVRTLADAEAYLQNGSLKSYAAHGFGFYAVVEKASGTTIGMCGLIKRDSLADTDIGYAFLPQYTGKGLGTEAASATVSYALHTLNFNRLIAIVNPRNLHSVSILKKIGMRFEQMIPFENQPEPLALFVIEK